MSITVAAVPLHRVDSIYVCARRKRFCSIDSHLCSVGNSPLMAAAAADEFDEEAFSIEECSWQRRERLPHCNWLSQDLQYHASGKGTQTYDAAANTLLGQHLPELYCQEFNGVVFNATHRKEMFPVGTVIGTAGNVPIDAHEYQSHPFTTGDIHELCKIRILTLGGIDSQLSTELICMNNRVTFENFLAVLEWHMSKHLPEYPFDCWRFRYVMGVAEWCIPQMSFHDLCQIAGVPFLGNNFVYQFTFISREPTAVQILSDHCLLPHRSYSAHRMRWTFNVPDGDDAAPDYDHGLPPDAIVEQFDNVDVMSALYNWKVLVHMNLPPIIRNQLEFYLRVDMDFHQFLCCIQRTRLANPASIFEVVCRHVQLHKRLYLHERLGEEALPFCRLLHQLPWVLLHLDRPPAPALFLAACAVSPGQCLLPQYCNGSAPPGTLCYANWCELLWACRVFHSVRLQVPSYIVEASKRQTPVPGLPDDLQMHDAATKEGQRVLESRWRLLLQIPAHNNLQSWGQLVTWRAFVPPCFRVYAKYENDLAWVRNQVTKLYADVCSASRSEDRCQDDTLVYNPFGVPAAVL